MEANRKRKGFIKEKLVMSFHRAAKSASSTMPYASKVKPSHSASSTSSVGFIVNHDYVIPQPKQKVSFAPPDQNKFENLYGTVSADEGVDLKAAIYISCVQERFRLNS